MTDKPDTTPHAVPGVQSQRRQDIIVSSPPAKGPLHTRHGNGRSLTRDRRGLQATLRAAPRARPFCGAAGRPEQCAFLPWRDGSRHWRELFVVLCGSVRHAKLAPTEGVMSRSVVGECTAQVLRLRNPGKPILRRMRRLPVSAPDAQVTSLEPTSSGTPMVRVHSFIAQPLSRRQEAASMRGKPLLFAGSGFQTAQALPADSGRPKMSAHCCHNRSTRTQQRPLHTVQQSPWRRTTTAQISDLRQLDRTQPSLQTTTRTATDTRFVSTRAPPQSQESRRFSAAYATANDSVVMFQMAF